MSIHVSPTAVDTEALPAHVGERAKAPRRMHVSPLTGLLTIAFLGAVSYVINVWELRWPEGIGTSMWGPEASKQTIRDGQHVLYMKPWRQLRKSDIVLVKADPPYDASYTAKRIDKFDDQGRLWLLGDNRAESFDSEMYGWVEPSRVIGLCLMRLPQCFDGPGEEAVDGKGVMPIDPVMKLKKSSSPPAVYSSGFPRVYTWLSQKSYVFKLQFTTSDKRRPGEELFIPTHDGNTAMLYYFGEKAVLKIGTRTITVPQTELVTAMVVDVSGSDRIVFTTPSGFTYWRIWIYKEKVRRHKS